MIERPWQFHLSKQANQDVVLLPFNGVYKELKEKAPLQNQYHLYLVVLQVDLEIFQGRKSDPQGFIQKFALKTEHTQNPYVLMLHLNA